MNDVFSRRTFLSLSGLAAAVSALAGTLSWQGGAAKARAAEKKHILILTGSAREGGNSDLLAGAFARGAREAGHAVDIFACGRAHIRSCLGCERCWTGGAPCIQKDDFDELWPLLEQADMLVFCSPLYWYNVSGHLKCAVDRLYPYSKKTKPRDLKIREAMLLMCGESWFEKSFAGAAEAYRQMTGYKGWKDRGRLFATRVFDKGEIAGSSVLAKAEKMGREA
ncbi:MAG: flavodoxin family protein [Desulfovibrio sp.]|nr:flavodoxin family protein [Mailhella sp.]